MSQLSGERCKLGSYPPDHGLLEGYWPGAKNCTGSRAFGVGVLNKEEEGLPF